MRRTRRAAGKRGVVAVLLSLAATIAIVAPVPANAAHLTSLAYVTNDFGSYVSVVDTSTNTIIGTVRTGFNPIGVAVTPDGAFAYVANNGSSSVSVISTSTNAVVATVPVGGSPIGVAITPNGAFAYVATNGSSSVSVISTSTNAVVATVTGVIDPLRVAITPDGAFAYVTNSLAETVTVIDTSSNVIAGTIPIGDGPGGGLDNAAGIAITPSGQFAYVVNYAQSAVEVIATSSNTVIDTVPVNGATDVAFAPSGEFAYVTSEPRNSVFVIKTSTNTAIGAIDQQSGGPFGLAFTPDGAFAYVADFWGDYISVINTATNAIAATIPEGAGSGPSNIAITPPLERAVPPPAVSILSGPAKETASQKAVFTFKGVAGGAYECSIDNGPWTTCASGKAFGPLRPGDHLFQVRETLDGVTGPAASYRWTIDLPRACVLRVARARVYAATAKHKIRLVIHYTSYRPADVSVSYDLIGAKGTTTLGSASAKFKVAGVYRDPESLSGKEASRVRAAQLFKVHFRIPKTPHSCGRYYTKRLTIPKKFSGRTVWFQSDSTFAPGTQG
jgi:YVTN family beta-propeller protein